MSHHDDVTGGLSPWGHSAPRRSPSGKRVGRPVRASARRRAAHVGIGALATVGVAAPFTPAFHVATAGAIPAAGQGTAFVPVPFTRIVDTRSGSGAPAGPFVAPTTFTVPVLGVAGVPNDASVGSVAINLTAVPEAGAVVGAYLLAWDGSLPRPGVSSLNFAPGVPIANGLIVPVAADGTISIFGFGGVNVLVDVMGYFSSSNVGGATGATGAAGAQGAVGEIWGRSVWVA